MYARKDGKLVKDDELYYAGLNDIVNADVAYVYCRLLPKKGGFVIEASKSKFNPANPENFNSIILARVNSTYIGSYTFDKYIPARFKPMRNTLGVAVGFFNAMGVTVKAPSKPDSVKVFTKLVDAPMFDKMEEIDLHVEDAENFDIPIMGI